VSRRLRNVIRNLSSLYTFSGDFWAAIRLSLPTRLPPGCTPRRVTSTAIYVMGMTSRTIARSFVPRWKTNKYFSGRLRCAPEDMRFIGGRIPSLIDTNSIIGLTWPHRSRRIPIIILSSNGLVPEHTWTATATTNSKIRISTAKCLFRTSLHFHALSIRLVSD